MKARALSVLWVLSLASGLVLAGGRNPPGPGAQTTGASTTPRTLSNTTAVAAVSAMVTQAGGASGIASTISSMPGSTMSGNVVTSPPITVGATTVIISVNNATRTITVRTGDGRILFSTDGSGA